jgi:beta-lactamase class A
MTALALVLLLTVDQGVAASPDAGGLAAPTDAGPASRAPVTAAGRVEKSIVRVLMAPAADAAWFAPSFLDKIPDPASVLEGPVRSVREKLGALRAVVAAHPGRYRADFERGWVDVDAKLDDRGRFVGLFLHPVQPLPGTVAEALQAFGALPGKVSVATVVDGKPGPALAPDAPLAVGSAFKLAVLAALRARVTAGALRWADVVTLEARWRSLPSGVLRDWPVGTHMTIETLAGAMISISDNTAADALADLVGRAEVERRAPERVRPFLTTREAFVLKAPPNAPLLARWRRADLAGRRKLLPEIDARPLPSVSDFEEGPMALDVEWHFSTRELCDLMATVEDLPLMTISTELVRTAPDDRVAYKGGSEPGVLNLTAAVRRGARHVCVSATWNDTHELEKAEMFAATRGLLAALLR